jgi:cytoskeletal protein CcmA (bactofilin family)
MNTPKDAGKQTLVEEGTEFQGTLKSSCHVVVNGSIDGQIEAPSLTITGTGAVLGTVKARKLHSEGTLAGDIDAEDVYLSGTVRSNTMIRARQLEVKLAPDRGKLEVTFGECLVEVGEDPAVQQEPVVTEAVEEKVAEAAPAIAADAVDAQVKEDEPTWSEPPPGSLTIDESAIVEEAAMSVGDADMSLAKDNAGKRSAKRNHQRDSQAPMA